MSRQRADKPWLHTVSGFYCATIAGKRVYLDRDFKVACQKLKRMQAEAKRRSDPARRDWLDAPFIELVNEFLDDIKARRSPGTYRNCQERLARSMEVISPDLRVGEVRRYHLSKIEQKLGGNYSSATIRDTLATVQQVFNFAVRNDLLDYSPVAGYRKPSARGRSRLVTPAEFQTLLKYSDVCFRRFLLALRLTGCRPGEARMLTWEMVDLENGLWVLTTHKTISMQRDPTPRIIPLPPAIWNLCRWLARRPHSANDPVFLNSRGKAYTKDGVSRKLARIRTRARIEKRGGENLVLYSNRHTYATRAVGRVSDTELASLMGHTTTKTLRRYVHLNAEHLRDVQRRLQRSSAGQESA